MARAAGGCRRDGMLIEFKRYRHAPLFLTARNRLEPTQFAQLMAKFASIAPAVGRRVA